MSNIQPYLDFSEPIPYTYNRLLDAVNTVYPIVKNGERKPLSKAQKKKRKAKNRISKQSRKKQPWTGFVKSSNVMNFIKIMFLTSANEFEIVTENNLPKESNNVAYLNIDNIYFQLTIH